LTHIVHRLSMIQKDMRLNPLSLQSPLGIPRSAEMRHLCKPGVQLQSPLKTRAARPKKVSLTAKIDTCTFRQQAVRRRHRHFAVSVATFVSKLKPIQRLARQRFEARWF